MGILAIILLLILQVLAGWGIITLFKLQLKPAFILPLSVLMGIAVFSVVPFLLQLAYIPITFINVFSLLLVATLLLNIRFAAGLKKLKQSWGSVHFKVALYEVPFLLMIGCIILLSTWRCFYFPPTPSDVTTGAEAIAEYAVRERTMINSVFELAQNGNTLKPPFITCLQIIYKFAGFPFGQIWLSSIFVSFTILLYHVLSTTLHRLLAGFLLVVFLAIPEMYAYTFMILYDYSNAVFFFLAVYFLISYFKNQRINELTFAGLLAAIATYIRPETLLLSFCLLPVIFLNKIKNKKGLLQYVKESVVFMLPVIIVYVVAVYIYINWYLPGTYNITDQVNPHLGSVKSILQQFSATNDILIFSMQGVVYYGYFIFIFLGFVLAELIFKRKFTATALNYLAVILIIYLFFPLLSHALPGVSIDYTVKRAFQKMFPLMLLYMANNGLLIDLSEKIKRWELKGKVKENG
jgi:hypothetical protein